MIDRKLRNCAQKARRQPQTAAVGTLRGLLGPSEACLMRRADARSAFGGWQMGNPGSDCGYRLGKDSSSVMKSPSHGALSGKRT